MIENSEISLYVEIVVREDFECTIKKFDCIIKGWFPRTELKRCESTFIYKADVLKTVRSR